jgi:hypothetical protein
MRKLLIGAPALATEAAAMQTKIGALECNFDPIPVT